MEKLAYIYFLSSRDGIPRYVGKTCLIKRRLVQHKSPRSLKTKTHKNNWIKSIGKENLEIHLIDEVQESDWPFWEMHYISLFKSWNYMLTNSDNGGRGLKITKVKLLKVKKQRPTRYYTEGQREAIRQRTTGVIHSEETKRKIAESLRGIHRSEQAIKKAAASNRGKKRSKEFCDNLSKIHTGRKLSEESKALIGKAQKDFRAIAGKQIHTKETLSKIALANTGVVFSQERKDKIKQKALERARLKKLNILIEILASL